MDGVSAVGEGQFPDAGAIELRVDQGIVALIAGGVAIAGGGGDGLVPAELVAITPIAIDVTGVGDVAGGGWGSGGLEVDGGWIGGGVGRGHDWTPVPLLFL